MRVGFYGNVNNYPFMLARAMHRLGCEVVFIVSSETPLDRPENRYPELAPPYPAWIQDLSPRWKTYFPTPTRRRCIKLLQTCDFVVLNQLGPSLSQRIARPAIALTTGSDLQYFANWSTIRGLFHEQHREPRVLAIPLKLLTFPRLIRNQREGLRSAALVTHFARGIAPEGDRLLDEIGVPDSRRMMLLMTETDRIEYVAPPSNRVTRTFCATRLNWKRPIPPGFGELDYKGSDVMIRGIGQHLRESGGRLDVRLVRKGLHVAESMELIRAEGFSDQVTWLDEMSQEAVLAEYRQADILFEQFDHSLVAMAGLDGMATGRPVIANSRPEIMEPAIGAKSPICHATTPGEVAGHLSRLAGDAVERERIGIESRRHVERFFSASAAAQRCIEWMKTSMAA